MRVVVGLLGAEPLALPRTCLDAMRLSWVENSTADVNVAPSPLFFPGGREETATEVCLPYMGTTWKQTEAGLELTLFPLQETPSWT